MLRDPTRLGFALSKSIENHTDYDIEYRIKFPSDGYHWLAAKGRPIYGKDGQLQGMLGMAQDITARKKNEAALRESNERLESRVRERTTKLQETIAELESFSYSISHDLRAPLRAMQGFSHVLLEDYAKKIGPDETDYLQRIIKASERMDRLIQDVLA